MHNIYEKPSLTVDREVIDSEIESYVILGSVITVDRHVSPTMQVV